MRGAPERASALVLRTIKLGDTSKIVSALSYEHGRVRLVAKGARQMQSRWAAALEPGNEVELLIYVRPGRELWTMGDAQLLRSALTGVSSLPKLSHLFAALELAERLLPEQEPVPGLSTLYRSFIERWHQEPESSMAGLFFALELALADQLGIALDVSLCAECATPLAQVRRAAFAMSDGVLRCENCAGAIGRWVDAATLLQLRNLTGGVNTATLCDMNDQERGSIGRLLHEHLGFHLSSYRVPRSLYWLRSNGAAG